MLGAFRPVRVAGSVIAVGLIALFALSTAARAAEYEPNDLRETAFGPLAGGVDYTATFETDNDSDWYLFYIRTYSQMDFSATSIGSSCANETEVELRDKDGKSIDYFHPGSLNQTNHLRLTLNPGRYYFEIDNDYCTGHSYRFRIDPAAAITTSRVCGEAIVARDSVAPEVAKLQGELGKNGEALSRASATVRSAKATLIRLKRNHASRYSKQRARRRLVAAQAVRGKVLEQKVALQTLGAQYAQTIAQAEAQIAASC